MVTRVRLDRVYVDRITRVRESRWACQVLERGEHCQNKIRVASKSRVGGRVRMGLSGSR